MVFTPTTTLENVTVNVAAGLAPLSAAGLENISLHLIPILAGAYSIAFITDPRFVTEVAPVRCLVSDPNCLSLLMPGGMQSVRVNEGKNAGWSLYIGDFAGDYNSIIINDAPAYHIEYAPIDLIEPGFSWSRAAVGGDCNMFGADIGEGIYICMHEAGNSMHFGMLYLPLPAPFWAMITLIDPLTE